MRMKDKPVGFHGSAAFDETPGGYKPHRAAAAHTAAFSPRPLRPNSHKSFWPHLLHQASTKNSSYVSQRQSLPSLCTALSTTRVIRATTKPHVQESKLFCLLRETERREEGKAGGGVRLGATAVPRAGVKLQEVSRIDSTQRKGWRSGSLKPSPEAPEEEVGC